MTDLHFERRDLALATYNLFDLGVVDARGRGQLDVFTTNHNSRDCLLINDGTGQFTDQLTELGLAQDSQYPSWAHDEALAALDGPGLYIQRRHKDIVVRSHLHPGRVEMQFHSPFSVGRARGAINCEVGDRAVVINARGTGRVAATPQLEGLPVTVRLESTTDASTVFIGAEASPMTSDAVVLQARDRHGIAWSRELLFVARGGLRGRVATYSDVIADEVFAARGDGYQRVDFDESCRGRQAMWVDVDGDGRAHLFISCVGAAPRLYRVLPDGRFEDAGEQLALSPIRGRRFLWADVDGDGVPELLAAASGQLTVYARADSGALVARQVLPLRGAVSKLALGDFDGDGDCDVLAVGPRGNTLLINDDGTFRAVDPRRVGLPGASATANWVDIDNDGQLELHTVPGGLYRRAGGEGFARVRGLPKGTRLRIADARVAWFDARGTGYRDVVIAHQARSRTSRRFAWRSAFYENHTTGNNWLQVELQGPPRNPMAIGASVTARVGERTMTQWVGANDGSHFSHGHYRVYFGLGEAVAAEDLAVRWSDGSSQSLGRVAGSQLVCVAAGS